MIHAPVEAEKNSNIATKIKSNYLSSNNISTCPTYTLSPPLRFAVDLADMV